MRTAEWITLLTFLFFVALAFLRPLDWRRRSRVLALGALGIGLIFIVNVAARFISPIAESVLRDWLPGALILMPYWQAGQFFTRPNARLQALLERLDRRWFDPLRRAPRNPTLRGLLAAYFELAYALCYPLLPCALGALYLLDLRIYVDEFWTAVLPPTFFCQAMIPFLATLPPRMRESEGEPSRDSLRLRALNLSILRRASIQANVFPSAHVAASLAASLELLRLEPLVGLLFLWVSISIAVGAVARRYHYALDVILGAAVATAAFAPV